MLEQALSWQIGAGGLAAELEKMHVHEPGHAHDTGDGQCMRPMVAWHAGHAREG